MKKYRKPRLFRVWFEPNDGRTISALGRLRDAVNSGVRTLGSYEQHLAATRVFFILADNKAALRAQLAWLYPAALKTARAAGWDGLIAWRVQFYAGPWWDTPDDYISLDRARGLGDPALSTILVSFEDSARIRAWYDYTFVHGFDALDLFVAKVQPSFADVIRLEEQVGQAVERDELVLAWEEAPLWRTRGSVVLVVGHELHGSLV